MEVVRSKKAVGAAVAAAAAEERKNAIKLTMYDEAPQGDVTLEDFEAFAVDRLRGACVCAK